MESVVFRKLHTGHHPQDTVLKHQHQHSRKCAQAGQQTARRLVDQNTDDDNGAKNPDDALDELHEAAQREFPLVFPGIHMTPHHHGECIKSHRYHITDINPGESRKPGCQRSLRRESELYKDQKNHRRHEAARL